MATRDDVRTSTLALIGFIGVVVVVAIILLLTVLYYRTANRLDNERRINEPYGELENALADQEARLVEYDITGAMGLVVKEWASGARPGPPAPPDSPLPAETNTEGVDKVDAEKPSAVKEDDASDAAPESAPEASPTTEEGATEPEQTESESMLKESEAEPVPEDPEAQSTPKEPDAESIPGEPETESTPTEQDAEPKEAEASDSGDVEDSDVPEDADGGGTEESEDAGP